MMTRLNFYDAANASFNYTAMVNQQLQQQLRRHTPPVTTSQTPTICKQPITNSSTLPRAPSDVCDGGAPEAGPAHVAVQVVHQVGPVEQPQSRLERLVLLRGQKHTAAAAVEAYNVGSKKPS
jgi:hypothetical protein